MADFHGKNLTLWMRCAVNLAELSEQRKRRVYGRRQGRPLHASRQEAIDNLLPVLEIPRDMLFEDKKLSLEKLFGVTPKKLHVEIGFGSGEHLDLLMESHPDDFFIGAEPYINGMSAFLKTIENKPHDHVRVLMDDALLILNSLPDSCVDFIYVLNPDPWPKSRHHKRRIISQENLNVFARVMKNNAQLLETTDVDDLAEWMVTQTINHGAFEWHAQSAQDWKTPPPNWSATRYESKGQQAGRSQTYLLFTRKARESL